MKNKFMQTAAGTILGLLILIGCTQLFVFGQESKNESLQDSTKDFSRSRSIVGTWQTMVTPRNCQTGAAGAAAFPGILTFNQGGTLTGTSTAVSSVYGVWKQLDGDERSNGEFNQNYSFAFISLRYSPTGAFIGTQIVRQAARIEARGNNFTSTGSVEVFDANGSLIATGCSTSTGTRFE